MLLTVSVQLLPSQSISKVVWAKVLVVNTPVHMRNLAEQVIKKSNSRKGQCITKIVNQVVNVFREWTI